MSVNDQKKLIARTALNAFGGKPTVTKYWDDNKHNSIDILTTIERPYEGVSSFSTIGLLDYSIGYSVDETPLRLEIVGAIGSEYANFPNILATCAFFVINSKTTCSPGTIFRDVVSMYEPSSEMKHILLVPPFLWEESLKTIDLPDKKVAWLLAVPISENEYIYASEKGTDALEDLFEKEEIDIFDLERKSVI